MEGVQLGFDIEAPRLVKVTPSRLATWRDCRRRYRLTYLDRPAPARGGAWAHNTLGAVVHLALRSLFALPPARRTADAAAALVDQHWTGEGFRDTEQAARYRERARGWVAAYVAELPADTEVVGVEQWVSVATGGIVAEGRVDRIDRRLQDLVIVDYKTGQRPLTTADAAGSEALALYAVAAERTLRRSCRRVELHHLPSGEVLAWEHDRATLDTHLTRAQETAAELADAGDAMAAGGDAEALFPPRPAPRCATCEVRRHCPEGRAAAPAPVSWELLAP